LDHTKLDHAFISIIMVKLYGTLVAVKMADLCTQWVICSKTV